MSFFYKRKKINFSLFHFATRIYKGKIPWFRLKLGITESIENYGSFCFPFFGGIQDRGKENVIIKLKGRVKRTELQKQTLKIVMTKSKEPHQL